MHALIIKLQTIAVLFCESYETRERLSYLRQSLISQCKKCFLAKFVKISSIVSTKLKVKVVSDICVDMHIYEVLLPSKLNFDICHATLHYETPNYASLYCGSPYHATYYIMYRHFPNLLQCIRNVTFNYYFSSLETIRLTVKILVHLKPLQCLTLFIQPLCYVQTDNMEDN